MPLPKFEATINLGHILIIISWAAGVFMAYSNIIRTTDNHQFRIQSLENVVSRSSEQQSVMTRSLFEIQRDLAVVVERINRE